MLLSEIIIEKETDKNVTISKESWKRIKKEILQTEKKMTKAELKKNAGIIKLNIDPIKYQKRIRKKLKIPTYKCGGKVVDFNIEKLYIK